jgi:hypothetical protein
MTDQPDPPATGGEGSGARKELHLFRLFFFYLPETSLIRRFRFQLVVISKFLSEIGHYRAVDSPGRRVWASRARYQDGEWRDA